MGVHVYYGASDNFEKKPKHMYPLMSIFNFYYIKHSVITNTYLPV